jgi:hypothetical protein
MFGVAGVVMSVPLLCRAPSMHPPLKTSSTATKCATVMGCYVRFRLRRLPDESAWAPTNMVGNPSFPPGSACPHRPGWLPFIALFTSCIPIMRCLCYRLRRCLPRSVGFRPNFFRHGIVADGPFHVMKAESPRPLARCCPFRCFHAACLPERHYQHGYLSFPVAALAGHACPAHKLPADRRHRQAW